MGMHYGYSDKKAIAEAVPAIAFTRIMFFFA